MAMTRHQALRLGGGLILLHALAGLLYLAWMRPPLETALPQSFGVGDTRLKVDYWGEQLTVHPDAETDLFVSLISIPMRYMPESCMEPPGGKASNLAKACSGRLAEILISWKAFPNQSLLAEGSSRGKSVSMPLPNWSFQVLFAGPLEVEEGMLWKPADFMVIWPEKGYRSRMTGPYAHNYFWTFPEASGCLGEASQGWYRRSPLGFFRPTASRRQFQASRFLMDAQCVSESRDSKLQNLGKYLQWKRDKDIINGATQFWMRPAPGSVCRAVELFTREVHRRDQPVLSDWLKLPDPLGQSPHGWTSPQFAPHSLDIMNCLCGNFDQLEGINKEVRLRRAQNIPYPDMDKTIESADQLISLVHYDLFRQPGVYSFEQWAEIPDPSLNVKDSPDGPNRKTDPAFWQEHRKHWQGYCDLLKAGEIQADEAFSPQLAEE